MCESISAKICWQAVEGLVCTSEILNCNAAMPLFVSVDCKAELNRLAAGVRLHMVALKLVVNQVL